MWQSSNPKRAFMTDTMGAMWWYGRGRTLCTNMGSCWKGCFLVAVLRWRVLISDIITNPIWSFQHHPDVLSCCTSQRRWGCFQGVLCCYFHFIFVSACCDPQGPLFLSSILSSPWRWALTTVFLMWNWRQNRRRPTLVITLLIWMQLHPVNQPCSCMTLLSSAAATGLHV